MNSTRAVCVVMVFVFGLAAGALATGPHSVGAGMHYWVATNDIDSRDFRDDSYALILSYQYTPGFFSFEFDLEYFPERYAGFDERTLAPQVFLLLGTRLYAGLGFGMFFTDGDFRDEFYVLRLGLDLPLSRSWSLDFNGNYHSTNFSNIKNVDEDIGGDSITLGLMLRYRF